ncbi:MAG: cation diffusion facilitator family transporter [bacterium]
MTAPSPSQRAIRMTSRGILLNTLLALVKFFAGFLGNSYALIADAMESMLDILGSVLVWGGLRIAAKPADANHPYGHGRAEPLASLAVSLMLIGAAGGIALQSVREIMTPHHAPAAFTLIVLALVIASKEFFFRSALTVGYEVGSTAVKTDAWHHRSDALTSTAAFIGISIALIGGKGYESADDWAALFACAIIGFNGYRLFKIALSEVMDERPPLELEKKARAIVASAEGVRGVGKCLLRKLGLVYHVDLCVQVEGQLTVNESQRIIRRVQESLRTSTLGIGDVSVCVEPFVKSSS